MYTIDQVHLMLNEIYNELPEYVFENLNLGIHLSPNVKMHKNSNPKIPLYILGEYKRDNMGRMIVIYYGSFITTFGYLDESSFREKLKETLTHELTHHMEDQGGEFQLEYEDFINLQNYKNKL